MFFLLKFSAKNAFRKKGVSALAILGVAVGISLMVFILSSSAGVNSMFQDSFTKAAAEISVSGSAAAPMGFGVGNGDNSLISEKYVKEIEKIENVEVVSSRVMAILPKISVEITDPFSILVGIDPEKDKKSEGPTTAIFEGRSFSKKNEIIVGKGFLQSASMGDGNKKDLEIGDTITVTIPPKKLGQKPKKVNLKIVGKFETGNFLEDFYIFSDETTARNIADVPKNKVSSIIVRADSIDDVEGVEKEIKAKLGKVDPPIQTFLNKDVFSNLQGTLNTFSQFRLAISVVAGIAGGMCILIVMLISVIERKKEFGILKAIGWSNRNITTSIMIESLILSLIGVFAGLLLGYLGITLSGYYLEIFQDILIIDIKTISIVLGFGVLTGVIGGVYPAWKASRVAPMEILRNT